MNDTSRRKLFRHYPEHIAVQPPDGGEREVFVAQVNLTVFTGDEEEDASGPQVHSIILVEDEVADLCRQLEPYVGSSSLRCRLEHALEAHISMGREIAQEGRSVDFAHVVRRLLRETN